MRRKGTLDADTVAVLKRHLKGQAAAQLKAGPKWQGAGNYIFTRPDGRPVEPNSISREFRYAVLAAGLRAIRLHDLRHYADTRIMPTRGAEPRLVAAGSLVSSSA